MVWVCLLRLSKEHNENICIFGAIFKNKPIFSNCCRPWAVFFVLGRFGC